jgi:uncharacterized protein YndB with AHSA1/START domain
MSGTQQVATPSEDYETTICVKASPGDLFDALTTVEGLTAWWNPASGSGESGGETETSIHQEAVIGAAPQQCGK